MTYDKIALPAAMKLTVGPAFPPPPTILIQNPITGRHLLSIKPDGTVTGEIEDASEAARVFFESLRGYLRQPQTDALKIARDAIRGLLDIAAEENLDSEQAGRAYAALHEIGTALAALEQSK
jgi:hypothetical protein